VAVAVVKVQPILVLVVEVELVASAHLLAHLEAVHPQSLF
jgi:hypothetical protein